MRHAEIPDPNFTRRFLAALPPDLAATFTPQQLMGVQRCFGLRHGGRHALDLRRSFWTPFGRFYLVLLAGPERRAPERRSFERLLAGGLRAGDVVVSAGLALALLLCLLGVLHTAKLLLGIDVFPGIDMLPDEPLIRLLRG
jgi:hypothetical protein